ncbi:MAG: hypothetical protein AAFP17_03855 [Pseudomonadota bacterium]
MATPRFVLGDGSETAGTGSQNYILDFTVAADRTGAFVDVLNEPVTDFRTTYDVTISGFDNDGALDFVDGETRSVSKLHLGNLQSFGLEDWGAGGFFNADDVAAFVETLFTDGFGGITGISVTTSGDETIVSFDVQGVRQSGAIRGEDTVELVFTAAQFDASDLDDLILDLRPSVVGNIRQVEVDGLIFDFGGTDNFLGGNKAEAFSVSAFNAETESGDLIAETEVTTRFLFGNQNDAGLGPAEGEIGITSIFSGFVDAADLDNLVELVSDVVAGDVTVTDLEAIRVINDVEDDGEGTIELDLAIGGNNPPGQVDTLVFAGIGFAEGFDDLGTGTVFELV